LGLQQMKDKTSPIYRPKKSYAESFQIEMPQILSERRVLISTQHMEYRTE